MKIHDISEPLYNGMTVWPGDEPFQFQLTAELDNTSCANVGFISLSNHTGTHIDAPYHFDNRGKKVQELDLALYVGRCKVIHIPDEKIVTRETLQYFDLNKTERLLIRTDSWMDRTIFPTNSPSIDPEIAPFLQANGVKLLGVDVPSVDPTESDTLSAHHALHQNGIHILERVVLSDIPAGDYELIALPLLIKNGDGSPVRAVLREYSS